MKNLSCLCAVMILSAFTSHAYSKTGSLGNKVNPAENHLDHGDYENSVPGPVGTKFSVQQSGSQNSGSGKKTGIKVAQASGVGQNRFAVARDEIPILGLDLEQHEPCQLRRTCNFTLEITNAGVWPYAGFLVIINAMPVPVRIGRYSLGWKCGSGRSGETLCITDVNSLLPGKAIRLDLSLTPRRKIPTGEALVCAGFLWPASWVTLEDDADTIQLFQFAANLQGFRAGPNDGKMGKRTRAAFKRALAASDEEATELDVENLAGALFGDGFPVPTRASEEVEHCADIVRKSKSPKPDSPKTTGNGGQAIGSTASVAD